MEDISHSSDSSNFHRADGSTPTERYLKKLCERTFLSLWSYPRVFRDQGRATGTGDGKEICDLLVIFENHIIIFSDKDCSFADSGDIYLDWCRWYRKAIVASAKQIWGAERWIKQHSENLYLDPVCTQRFPIPVPPPENAQFHRIIVAHEASKRCKEKLGGSGSLMLDSALVGDQHCAEPKNGGKPFAIGQVDPTKGFVHIFDDTSLDIIMSTLDTITDFVNYLIKKEQFLSTDTQIMVAGEEDLLALYLRNLNSDNEHDFETIEPVDFVGYEEGFWESFEKSEARKSQIQADKESYFWDELIERFTKHILDNTLYFPSEDGFANAEKALRWLAKEPRFRRRILSHNLLDLARTTPADFRRIRVIPPTKANDPYIVFLLLPEPSSVPYERYRIIRREYLLACCKVVRLRFPNAENIVGIATESGRHKQHSEDLLYYYGGNWTVEDEQDALKLQADLGILTTPQELHGKFYEYPSIGISQDDKKKTERLNPKLKGNARNQPCPCGSGKKYKQCHGKAR